MTADGYEVILAGRERRRNSRTSGEGPGGAKNQEGRGLPFASLHCICEQLLIPCVRKSRWLIVLASFLRDSTNFLKPCWIFIEYLKYLPFVLFRGCHFQRLRPTVAKNWSEEKMYFVQCWSGASSSALTAIRSPHYFLTCPLIWISSWSFPPDYSDFVLLAFSRSICHNINIHPPRRTQYYYDGVLP